VDSDEQQKGKREQQSGQVKSWHRKELLTPSKSRRIARLTWGWTINYDNLMRWYYFCVGMLSLSLETSPAGVVNIDFNLGATPTYSGLGAAPDSAGNIKWNGLAVTGGSGPGTATASSTFTGLVFSDNTPSGLSVTVKRTNQSDLPGGEGASGNPAANLLRDLVFVNSGNSGTQLSGSITFDGLTAGTTYDFYLYGAGSQSEQKTAFTIGGTTLQTTGASVATSDLTEGEDYVRFTGILPNASNQIVVTYANVITGSNPSQTGPVNGCQIVAVVPEPLPILQVLPVNSSEFQLIWPTDATDFHLETSTDLSLWDPVLDTPDIIEGEFVLTAAIIDPQRFFRLGKP
jgi:hypothetical protein